ncbi:MAG: cytochrome c [Actinobacteria bacterium]|nr:cytochrome c [Actinomycetota bacterium]MCI0544327.1 cytochrome c [Actinomycetota bacterium]
MRLLAAGLVILTACSVGRPPPDATGEEIYAQLCSNCHGDELEGRIGPSLGPGSEAEAQPDSFLELTILHGRGRMPSFSSTLDASQLERLIVYIREVQGR